MEREPTKRLRRGAVSTLAVALVLAACRPEEKIFDLNAYGNDLAASLVKACPMAQPSDVAAHESCRKALGNGAEAAFRGYAIQWGGEQPGLAMKAKKTTWFPGDLFQNLYLSLFMFTGEYKMIDDPDGGQVVAVQGYFRNALPPGNYPYPFWHSEEKWRAYERVNEIRLHFSKDGKLKFAGRSDAGNDDRRGPYAAIMPPAFHGQWMWTDESGNEQPSVTLFSDIFSPDNPKLAELDTTYRKTAIAFRNADCISCHVPTGHTVMNALTLLQTPQHAAGAISEAIKLVRESRMPVDARRDPKLLAPEVKADLLASGEAFQKSLAAASAWEHANGRPQRSK